MKVALYARFSTDTQDSTSIGGQFENCEAIAAREGLEVIARIQDEGLSGNDDNRPGYQSMLNRLEQGEFSGIVTDETSRITRNQAELHRLVAELRFRDHFLITCDGIDTRSESSDLMLSIKAAIDQMEGRKIGYRTYRSLRERHKLGYCAGGRIYGYCTEQDGDYRRRVIRSDQSIYVLEIFERYAAGDSAKAIVRDFNERGVPSPGSFWKKKRRASGWVHTTLLGSFAKASGILRNPIYAGRPTWNKRTGKKVPGTGRRIQTRRPESEWIDFKDESLRIVSDELWERVQVRLHAVRLRNHSANLRGRPARHLLTGLMVCDSCGGHYVIRNGKSYQCSSHSNGRDSLCGQRLFIKKETAEQALLAGIKEQLLCPEIVKAATRQIRAETRKQVRSKTDNKARIGMLSRQIDDLLETLIQIGKSDALTEKLRGLEKEKRELENIPTASVQRLVPNISDHWRDIVSNLERLGSRAKPDELETARELLSGLIGEVRITEEGGHVFGNTALLSNGAGYKSGAQERT